jgi:hypothetical protein
MRFDKVCQGYQDYSSYSGHHAELGLLSVERTYREGNAPTVVSSRTRLGDRVHIRGRNPAAKEPTNITTACTSTDTKGLISMGNAESSMVAV